MFDIRGKHPIKRSRRLRWFAVGLSFTLITVAVGSWIAGGMLIAPVPRTIDELPSGLPAREVVFDSRSGSKIHGWFAPAERKRAAIVLLHGLRGDRRAMLGRMLFLYSAGYSTLSIDFQGHGESRGKALTFGNLESHDAHAAVEFITKECPGQKIAVIGESLGGAACLLSDKPLEVDAFIFELVYPTLDRALHNRLQSTMGTWLTKLAKPLLEIQCKWRLGVEMDEMRPAARISELDAPVFVLGGELDNHTTPEETKTLFESASDPKQIWIVPGAGHKNLHTHAGAEYERRVLGFLGEYLDQN